MDWVARCKWLELGRLRSLVGDELYARELGSDVRLSNDLLQPSTKGAGTPA